MVKSGLSDTSVGFLHMFPVTVRQGSHCCDVCEVAPADGISQEQDDPLESPRIRLTPRKHLPLPHLPHMLAYDGTSVTDFFGFAPTRSNAVSITLISACLRLTGGGGGECGGVNACGRAGLSR